MTWRTPATSRDQMTIIIHSDGEPESLVAVALSWLRRMPGDSKLCGFREEGYEGHVMRTKTGLSVTVRVTP